MRLDIPPPEGVNKHTVAPITPSLENVYGDQLAQQQPEEEDLSDAYTASEKYVANMERWNPIVAGANRAIDRSFDPVGPADPDFNPFADRAAIAGYPADLFIKADSEAERERLKREYDHEMYQRHISETGGFMNVASSVFAGVSSPANFIPFYGLYSRGLSTAQFATRAAAAAAVQSTTEEAAFHMGLSHTRTFEESLENIMVSSIATGMLSTVVEGGKNVARSQINQIKASVREEMRASREFVGPYESPKAFDEAIQQAYGLKPNVEKLTGAQKFLARFTPMRLLASENEFTRQLAVELGEQGVVETTDTAIETLIKRHNRSLYNGYTKMADEFNSYKAQGGALGLDDFGTEVTRALRNGDLSDDPHITKAAAALRKDVIDPITREAQSVGLLPEDLVTKFAKSYFPRAYNRALIKSKQQAFIADIQQKIMARSPGIVQEEAYYAAKSVYDKILGADRYDFKDVYRTDFKIEKGQFKARTLNLTDDELEPWLVNNPRHVLNQWVHEITPHIELTRRYGSRNLEVPMKQVNNEYDRLINEAKSDKERARLVKARESEIETLEALRDRLLGRYGMSENPHNFWQRASRATRSFTTITTLGGMTLSSIPDAMRPIYYHGLGKYTSTLGKIMTDSGLRKMALADVRRMGAATEMVLDSRMRAFTQADWDPTTSGRVEAFLDAAAHGGGGKKSFGNLVLMTQWNDSMKGFAGIMSSDGLLRNTASFNANARALGLAGIDKKMARRINAQFKEFGIEHKGLKMANTHEWADKEAAAAFEGAVIKEVDSAIVTPGIMDRPLWMSTETGKLIGLFKSFMFAATNRILMSNMARGDANVMSGMIASLALGYMSMYIKDLVAGKNPADRDPKEQFFTALDGSGILGITGEIMKMGHKGAQAAGLAESKYHVSPESVMLELMGPAASKGVNLVQAVTQQNPAAARTLIPYNNVFYLRSFFDRTVEQMKSPVEYKGL